MRYNKKGNLLVSLRAKALAKLAQESLDNVKYSCSKGNATDNDSLNLITHSLPLFYSTNTSKLYTIPLNLNEWEVLISLSQSTVHTIEQAMKLLDDVISSYFLESPRQRFTDVLISKFKQEQLRHPNEILTFQLTRFILSLTNKFPELIKNCTKLIDGYLTSVSQLYCKKPSSMFSLIGFMHALIFDTEGASVEVCEFVWQKFTILLNDDAFFLEVEKVLNNSPNFTNDTMVQYFDAGHEICSSFFSELISRFQVSLALRVLHKSNRHHLLNPCSLSLHVLEIQKMEYDSKQEVNNCSPTEKQMVDNFKNAIETNKQLLIDICKFALRNCSRMDNLDLSSEDRAKFTFNSKAYFLELLCLIPYVFESNSKEFKEYLKLVCDFMETFLLTDFITEPLIKSIICSASYLNFFTEENSLTLLRMFPLLVASDHISNDVVTDISKIFTIGLYPLNEDVIVNTIYSINNMLSVTDSGSPKLLIKERKYTLNSITDQLRERAASPHTLDLINNYDLASGANGSSKTDIGQSTITSVGYHEKLFKNCVTAVTTIASNYNDQSITALTTTILTQKVNVVSKQLDKIIIDSLAILAPFTTPSEFSLMLKFFKLATSSAIKDGKHDLLKNINDARTMISKELKSYHYESELYKLHLYDLLDIIISSGEVEHKEHRTDEELSAVADQIGLYLTPLAEMLPSPPNAPLDISTDEMFTNMFRNIWFNMTIHGFYYDSKIVKKYISQLTIIAFNTPPLASDFPANKKEMSLEMNSILRRGSSNSNIKHQKQVISKYAEQKPVQPRSTSNTKIMFLAATVLLETIRCEAGDCSKLLLYFSDPSIVSSSIEKNIESINVSMIHKFTRASQSGKPSRYNSKEIARQLNNMLLLLVHKNALLQNVAFKSCELFIRTIPSSLCHHQSLYTLLDLMTSLFDGVIDCETNKFEPDYDFYLKHFNTKVSFPSSISWRRLTLAKLTKCAKEWVKYVLNRSSHDIKILLQSYISDLNQFERLSNVEYGVSFAMDMAGSILSVDKELSRLNYIGGEKPNTIAGFISQHSWRSKYLVDKAIASSPHDIFKEITSNINKINTHLDTNSKIDQRIIAEFLDLSAALIIHGSYEASSLIHNIVQIPFNVFTQSTLKASTDVWLTIMKERPELAHILLVEVGYRWMRSIDDSIGLYSHKYDITRAECQMMEYKPYNKKAINRNAKLTTDALEPHRILVSFFSSHFEGTLFQSDSLLKLFTNWVYHSVDKLCNASLHPFSRLIRNELLVFAVEVLGVNYKQNSKAVGKLCNVIVKCGLSWYKSPISWPFGANELRNKADLAVAIDLSNRLDKASGILTYYCKLEYQLLQIALQDEIFRMKTWLSPLNKIESNIGSISMDMIKAAMAINPSIAINIAQSLSKEKNLNELTMLISNDPLKFVGIPDALGPYLEDRMRNSKADLHYVTYWCPTTPLKSIDLFLPEHNQDRFILQYAVHSLEFHDVNVIFFYVPQIVQCLRYDHTGYVERLILDTAMNSVLFSHQIIWNMLANCYKGDEGLIEDEIKPTLDRVREKLVATFNKSHSEFYHREFKFFNEVTGISGKLKPYIKKSKAEKKQKIDEEMAKIVVEPGVYLPSNPDGIVIDINRKSGKPLQSHAKAPFMATFKIKKDVEGDNGGLQTVEKWQAAIFKVGDDCRQDVLALQLISMFRTIWSNIGLDVYVFPYRVTATAPGCGVIDVLPNSISRDMLGREAVNGLYEYFISKFGNETSFEFQNARNNFVKSLAGYSVISYLLQFKDRHNGNIMYDDQGHCLHIDFGFIFDIVPGGVKFEAVPFKLTKEMVNVMGGSQETQAYRDFEELCIKAYLAARPHMDAIIECVKPMLGSGLPCFKGVKTIRNLRNRFQPQKTEHEAAMYMKNLIRKSYESLFTKGYDEFQRLTNGIPY
ncbi:hypothetical protein Kpol_414p3 [Vanderwaltozyma polyspora DSM 70294]|uniref:1-phosphatidylinositol 4-kinase n=1 Tax=Vanderwaltozyma polyspora (strain ATCC 22028 / DSM 70294 / BCRC 21397 / CBS 2163 / NBRC 10782 / NRRL Y-8283 / UCD 57-17) TaxID=436907 RepID=A7TRY5_VANPO|nr:uncharacterized protein Kpol_414p3 [Vanderwaltozyma polyspora DSM 70294]EDO14970.1 hypothetical protein Kpol_414p3 [Vanderwaltozyma polyspora DSM 70294]